MINDSAGSPTDAGYAGKTRVLVLGGSGMLGHKLWRTFAPGFETCVTMRRSFDRYERLRIFDRARTIGPVSTEEFDSVVEAINTARPNVVVNCIGIVKQSALARDPLVSISVNALFPHRLAQACLERGIRLIHISTDCVFSGREGNYTESDVSDAEDMYGKTKFLGEVDYERCLTLRTSIVGREIETSNGLIEWLLSQDGKQVNGYARSIFSGLTTTALAEIIARIIGERPDMRGVWHVASAPISKHDLLLLVRQIYHLGIEIVRDETVIVDRSLNADRFYRETGFPRPAWHDMIERMYQDPTPYSELRRQHADR